MEPLKEWERDYLLEKVYVCPQGHLFSQSTRDEGAVEEIAAEIRTAMDSTDEWRTLLDKIRRNAYDDTASKQLLSPAKTGTYTNTIDTFTIKANGEKSIWSMYDDWGKTFKTD